MCNISCHCAIPGSWFITQCKSTKLLHQPWSYWTYSEAWDAVVVYLFSTLSSIKADPLNRLKHPGLHSTEPNTCSAVFCSQWPTAYSNFWYHTMGPGMADSDRDKCEMRDKLQQWHQKMFETYLLNYFFFSTQSQWRLWKLGSILSYTGFITIIWLLDCIKSMQTHQCCIWNQYIFTLIALFTKKAVPVNSYAIFNQVSTWATNWHMNDIMVLMIYVIICDHFRACIWGASPLHLDLHSRWFATKEAITQPKLILAIIVILYWLQVHVKAWPWSCTHLNLVRWNYCAFCYRCHNLISLRNCAK